MLREGRAARIRALVIIFLAVLVISPAEAVREINPGTAHIRITSQVITRDKTGRIRVSASSLYNKHISPNAIGNSITRCIQTGPRRTLPLGTQYCSTAFRFPLGQIITAGIVTSPVYYKMAVLGGTGTYANVGGEVRVIATRLVPRKENIVFTLHAF